MPDQHQETHSMSFVTSTSTAPTVAVFGCGGGGINMVRAACSEFHDRAAHYFLDTSDEWINTYNDVKIIGGGGAGLVRRHHADDIVQNIANLSDEDIHLADINIVVFSLSGGSGSVIGPMLIRDIVGRRKKLAIAMTIASAPSQTHLENMVKTLQTLTAVTADKKIYLPISIFNNTRSIELVDQVMPIKLVRLVDLLTMPTTEVDKNDRIHWVDGQKTISASPGLRLLHVTCDEGDAVADTSCEVWPGFGNYIFDAVLSLRTDRHRVNVQPKARASYSGLFSTVSLVPMMGIIGHPPTAFDKLNKEIADLLTTYNAQPKTDTPVCDWIAPQEAVDPITGLFL